MSQFTIDDFFHEQEKHHADDWHDEGSHVCLENLTSDPVDVDRKLKCSRGSFYFESKLKRYLQRNIEIIWFCFEKYTKMHLLLKDICIKFLITWLITMCTAAPAVKLLTKGNDMKVDTTPNFRADMKIWSRPTVSVKRVAAFTLSWSLEYTGGDGWFCKSRMDSKWGGVSELNRKLNERN